MKGPSNNKNSNKKSKLNSATLIETESGGRNIDTNMNPKIVVEPNVVGG